MQDSSTPFTDTQPQGKANTSAGTFVGSPGVRKNSRAGTTSKLMRRHITSKQGRKQAGSYQPAVRQTMVRPAPIVLFPTHRSRVHMCVSFYHSQFEDAGVELRRTHSSQHSQDTRTQHTIAADGSRYLRPIRKRLSSGG
jgi:hypothetical protein